MVTSQQQNLVFSTLKFFSSLSTLTKIRKQNVLGAPDFLATSQTDAKKPFWSLSIKILATDSFLGGNFPFKIELEIKAMK
jgi:hypothetical protein